MTYPDIKVHGANMGPIWGRQDPGGPHVGPMNFAIWVDALFVLLTFVRTNCYGNGIKYETFHQEIIFENMLPAKYQPPYQAWMSQSNKNKVRTHYHVITPSNVPLRSNDVVTILCFILYHAVRPTQSFCASRGATDVQTIRYITPGGNRHECNLISYQLVESLKLV